MGFISKTLVTASFIICYFSNAYTQAIACDSLKASFTHQIIGNSIQLNGNSGSTSAHTYYWKFGDGSTSTIQNPLHTYTNSGTYTITLNVGYNYPGGCCHDSIISTITLISPCDSFSAVAAYSSVIIVKSPYKVLLGGAPSASGGTAPYSYQWTTSSTCASVSNVSISNPIGTVCTQTSMFNLKVTDSNGCVAYDSVRVDTSCNSEPPITSSPCDSLDIIKNYINNGDGTITATYSIQGLNHPSLQNGWWRIDNPLTPNYDFYGFSDTSITVTYNNGTILDIVAWAYAVPHDTCGPSFKDTLGQVSTSTSLNHNCDSNVLIAKNQIDNGDGTYSVTYSISGLNQLPFPYGSYHNSGYLHGQIGVNNPFLNRSYDINGDTVITITANYNQTINLWLPIYTSTPDPNSSNDTCNIYSNDSYQSSSTSVSSINNQINRSNYIKIYPNPAQNSITVDLEINSKVEPEIIIKDMIGKTVKTESIGLNASKKTSTVLNINKLSPGGYLVSLIDKKSKELLTKPVRLIKR